MKLARMGRRAVIISLSALFSSCWAAAVAEEFVIPVRKPDAAFETVKIDIAGMSPQMNAEQVESALKKSYGAKGSVETFKYTFPDTEQKFVNAVRANPRNVTKGVVEFLYAFFSSPASGARNWFIYRDVDYNDEAKPGLGDTLKAIFDKYSTPTVVRGSRLYWFYKSGSKVDGPVNYTPASVEENFAKTDVSSPVIGGIDTIVCGNVVTDLNPKSGPIDIVSHNGRTKHVDCQGYFSIAIGSDGRRVHGLTFKLVDYPLVRSASAIDLEAFKQAKEFKRLTAPVGAAPKL